MSDYAYSRVPGGGPRRYNETDKRTGETREVSYRSYLNAEKRERGFKNQAEYEKLLKQSKDPKSYLGERFRKYVEKGEGKKSHADFLSKYKKGHSDRGKVKGDAYWGWVESYSDEDEEYYLERAQNGISTFD